MKKLPAGVLSLLSGALPAVAQPQVDSRNLHERIVAVVPLTGAGPSGSALAPPWVWWSWQPTDDGKTAIVELAPRNPAAIRAVLRDTRVVVAFQKHKAKRSDVNLQAGSLVPLYRDVWTMAFYLYTDSTGAEYRLDRFRFF